MLMIKICILNYILYLSCYFDDYFLDFVIYWLYNFYLDINKYVIFIFLCLE